MATTKTNDNGVKFLKRGFTSDEWLGAYVAKATCDYNYVEVTVAISDSSGSGGWVSGCSVSETSLHEGFLEDLDRMEKFGMAIIAAAANARQVIEDAQAKQLELKFD